MNRGLHILAVATIVAGIAAPAYSQTASPSAASAQGGTAELRAATIVAPPFVMEENGSLTGFSIELWNAIAAQLKLKTSYQMVPDVGALEEAMRSKRAELVVAPVFITSARDEAYDFSYPTMEAGLQFMERDTGEKVQTSSPLQDMLRLLFSPTTVLWLGMA